MPPIAHSWPQNPPCTHGADLLSASARCDVRHKSDRSVRRAVFIENERVRESAAVQQKVKKVQLEVFVFQVY